MSVVDGNDSAPPAMKAGERWLVPVLVALDMSILLKRDGDWDGSVELWQRVAEGRGRIAALACVELAKFYEHRTRLLDSAREMCDQARRLSAGDQDYWGGQLSDGELNHRRGRLARKLAVPAAARVSKVPTPATARPGGRFRQRT